ncbi:MAG: septum formation initiator family protein [Chloroflexi bacterium]|nr:septum formation initiator family protein [Chloroflexota bacterium]
MPTSKSLSTNLPTPSPTRNIRLALVILIVLCLIFIVSYTARLAKRAQLGVESHQWEERIEQATQKRLVLEAERQYVDSDAYVQKEARDELGMAKAGDSIVIVIPSTPTPLIPSPEPQTETTTKVAGQANWQQWFELFVPDAGATQPGND